MRKWVRLSAAWLTVGGLLLGGGRASATPPQCSSPCIVTSNYNVVTHTVTTVNNLSVDQYSWFDSKQLPRTVSLKREGNGNSGHGGYAIQMTYLTYQATTTPHYATVTVNAENSGDGGFGYFVSHERYRYFANGDVNTIAGEIFGKDDSPLGNATAVTQQYIPTKSGTAASVGIRYKTTYHHYGTKTAVMVDPDTGEDSPELPSGSSNYTLYNLPVTMTWIFQALKDDPRYIVQVDLSQVGKADLVNFDLRAPYGVMVFDNGADGTVTGATWGDQAYLFKPAASPITRATGWDWSAANTGGRFNALQAGGYEMGLYEPVNVSSSFAPDGYAPERGATSASYGGTSDSSCYNSGFGMTQTLPGDGYWPYQSVQYSLPCPSANTPSAINTARTTPATGKKLAWGTTSYLGSSLSGVYNGQNSYPLNGYPSSGLLQYSLCISLGQTTTGGLTQTKATAYESGNPNGVTPVCATATAK